MPRLDEFAIIERLFAPLAASYPGALGLTDDAALLAGPGSGPSASQWVVTMDAIVAGVHFLPDDPPALIARKLIRVNLSDLAAKGATPEAVLLAACFPTGTESAWLDDFASGMKSDCAHFRVALIGGDTVETPGPLTLVMTAFGKTAAESAILRSNARSGDDIWVSGTIGDAVLGLVVAQGGTIHGLDPADAAWLLDRYRLPQPRIDLGLALVGLVHSGMDISDGLVGDLGHLSAVSRLAAVVDVDAVPLSAAARRALCLQGAPGLGDLITGGDDYELLFTAPPEQQASIVAQSQACGVPVARIGHMSEGEGVRVVDAQGQAIMLAQTGYRHFTGGTR